MNEFSGEVTASFIDIRFAYAGVIAKIYKHNGDKIKKGEPIASLDKKLLQIKLDKQLADYEKIRADFELFSIKHEKEDADDTIKYLRQRAQADLNSSVKDIEDAKFNMDLADMHSPIDGIIIDIQGLVPGLYITPASSTIKILDMQSITFTIDVPQEELFQFSEERNMKITIDGIKESFVGQQKLPTYGKNGKFTLPIPIDHAFGLYPGMKGKATFKLD